MPLGACSTATVSATRGFSQPRMLTPASLFSHIHNRRSFSFSPTLSALSVTQTHTRTHISTSRCAGRCVLGPDWLSCVADCCAAGTMTVSWWPMMRWQQQPQVLSGGMWCWPRHPLRRLLAACPSRQHQGQAAAACCSAGHTAKTSCTRRWVVMCLCSEGGGRELTGQLAVVQPARRMRHAVNWHLRTICFSLYFLLNLLVCVTRSDKEMHSCSKLI